MSASLQPPAVPPPYRAPPNPAVPFSKLNVSEPNIHPQQQQQMEAIRSNMSPKTNPSYRHTINHDNSQSVQHTLKNMLHHNSERSHNNNHLNNNNNNNSANSSKHATLDGSSQNIALQHLRMASHERGNLFRGGTELISRTEDPKRHSYSNNSFRKATQEVSKAPPIVPPKPRLKDNHPPPSSSKDDLENDHLEAELKHILREGGFSKNVSHIHGNGTPPLPALSPGKNNKSSSP
ncbi:Putative LOC100168618 [Caligus rogercresseyi]|uniref:LOC100168618 n=1 Tax=Caligus rogercresseyi TaxID=217165 RepID=A0A7T8HJE5_CALRO|nr:Putative LOC100168618 [Caligus rogercresseyi]